MGLSKICKIFLTALLPLFFLHTKAAADPTNWKLPLQLNDSNTTVNFEADSTWHVVHGTTKGVRGKIWSSDQSDPSSVLSEIFFPVGNFNTDNDSRDEKLREVMAEVNFKDVVFRSTKLEGGCTPETVINKGSCSAALVGNLEIRGQTKPVKIDCTIKKEGQGFQIDGSLPIKWPDYGVEDPSIIIARLDKIVTVHFKVMIPS